MHKKFLFSLSGGDKGKTWSWDQVSSPKEEKSTNELYENNIKK